MTALSGLTMGTSWSVKAVLPRGGAPTAQQVAAAVQQALDSIVGEMSNWEAGSDISRFNRTPPGEWVALPDAFRLVLDAGLDIARASGGAFDPAVGHAVDRWGFGPGEAGSPHSISIPAAANWTAIERKGNSARRLAVVALDFSGIAKGHGVDAAARALRDMGLAHFLVEVGGELYGAGVRPDGQPWWVDLETPPDLTLPVARVALCDLAVATSGDYRRFLVRDGQRISHSIDPRTGTPVGNGVASVTVLHPCCMLADAWATAILVAGVEEGLAMANREGLAALLVERAGPAPREHWSRAMAAMLEDR